jgi:hypothetical protein
VKKLIYQHDKGSIVNMWEEIGKEFCIGLDIHAEYDSGDTVARDVVEKCGINIFAGSE